MKNLKICIILMLCTAIFLPKAFSLSPEAVISKTTTKPIYILIIDDQIFWIDYCRKILKVLEDDTANFKISVIKKDALEFIGFMRDKKGIEFDIIITDEQMPDMNGTKIIEQGTNQGLFENTKIFLMSSKPPSDFNYDDYGVTKIIKSETKPKTILELVLKTVKEKQEMRIKSIPEQQQAVKPIPAADPFDELSDFLPKYLEYLELTNHLAKAVFAGKSFEDDTEVIKHYIGLQKNLREIIPVWHAKVVQSWQSSGKRENKSFVEWKAEKMRTITTPKGTPSYFELPQTISNHYDCFLTENDGKLLIRYIMNRHYGLPGFMLLDLLLLIPEEEKAEIRIFPGQKAANLSRPEEEKAAYDWYKSSIVSKALMVIDEHGLLTIPAIEEKLAELSTNTAIIDDLMMYDTLGSAIKDLGEAGIEIPEKITFSLPEEKWQQIAKRNKLEREQQLSA